MVVHHKHAALLNHADVREAQLHEAFHNAVYKIRKENLDIGKLRIALKRGDVEGALAALPSYFDIHAAMNEHLRPLIEETINRGRQHGNEHRPMGKKL